MLMDSQMMFSFLYSGPHKVENQAAHVVSQNDFWDHVNSMLPPINFHLYFVD